MSTFVRDCGATTDYATIVTLHASSAHLRSNEDIVFSAKGDHRIELTWKDAEHLVIDCRSCEERQVVTRMAKHRGVEIQYQR